MPRLYYATPLRYAADIFMHYAAAAAPPPLFSLPYAPRAIIYYFMPCHYCAAYVSRYLLRYIYASRVRIVTPPCRFAAAMMRCHDGTP